MQIIFQGSQSTDEAAESLLSILKLFRERYGIEQFSEMNLQVTLLDQQGHDVELVDASTSEVYGVFEVYQSNQEPALAHQPARRLQHGTHLAKQSHLKLVVDNTK